MYVKMQKKKERKVLKKVWNVKWSYLNVFKKNNIVFVVLVLARDCIYF